MTTGYPIESILAIECGNTTTRAILIDIVGGSYRLIARGEALSTWRPPHGSMVLGVARAVAEIEKTVGRRLLDGQSQVITPENIDGSGVDAVVVTAGAGAPLRFYLAGLSPALSLASAGTAVSCSGGSIVETVSVEDGIDAPHFIESFVGRIESLDPEVVILVGGIESSDGKRVVDLARLISLAYQVSQNQHKPPVLYAGNGDYLSGIVQQLGGFTDVRPVDNVRPSLGGENLWPLTDELDKLYVERRLLKLPGMDILSRWSKTPLIPSWQAQRFTLAYLSALYGTWVAGLDVGAQRSSVFWAHSGWSEMVSRGEWGVAAGNQILEHVGINRILSWLPEPCPEDRALEEIYNMGLYQGVIPASRLQSYLVDALARECLFDLVLQARFRWAAKAGCAPPWGKIILAGSTLAGKGCTARSALVALDVLQPVGVATLAIDHNSMLAAIGAMAVLEPSAAAQVLEHDGLTRLGTVIAPQGNGRAGQPAIRMKMEQEDGSSLAVEVPSGALEIVPLPADRSALVEVQVGRRFSLGQGTKKMRLKVEGGSLGLILDARGRPLPAASDLASSQARMARWLSEIGAL